MVAKLIITGVVLATLFAIYWFMIRPVLHANPSLKPVFDQLDAQEATFWGLLRKIVKGWKTILWSRFLGIAGVVGAVMGEILPDLQTFLQVPGLDEWLTSRSIAMMGMGLMVIGLVNERLRRVSDGPVAQAPASDPLTPEPPSV